MATGIQRTKKHYYAAPSGLVDRKMSAQHFYNIVRYIGAEEQAGHLSHERAQFLRKWVAVKHLESRAFLRLDAATSRIENKAKRLLSRRDKE